MRAESLQNEKGRAYLAPMPRWSRKRVTWFRALNVPTLVFSRRSSSYQGAVLKFWQLDYHLQASAKSMIRTALASQGWCGRVSGVFWSRIPFQFMDGGSVRIPGWATV